MSITIALGIPHAPWVEGRPQSMARLRVALGIPQPAKGGHGHYGNYARDDGDLERPEFYREFTEKEPNWSWAGKLLAWGLKTGADWLLQLQDDVEVTPEFWKHVRAMLEARPGQIIGLETAHEAARIVADAGEKWCTTNDGLIGVGWAIPREVLAELVTWRLEALKDGALEKVTEDTLIDVFAVATGRRIHHPAPTIIDHDTTVPSSYGNDQHTRRKPVATWKTHALPTDWSPGERKKTTHLGNFYGESIVELTRRALKVWDEDIARRNVAASGTLDLRRLARTVAERGEPLPFRVLIGTPTRGDLNVHHADAVTACVMAPMVDVRSCHEIHGVLHHPADVVLTRSRLARIFRSSDATDLWFIDSDVAPTPDVLLGMLRARMAGNKGILCCPYPRRDHIDLRRAATVALIAQKDTPPEAAAYAYSVGFTAEQVAGRWAIENDCARVPWASLGCALIPRAAFETMIDYAREAPARRAEILRKHAELAWTTMAGGRATVGEMAELFRSAFDNASQHREDELFFDDVEGQGIKETAALFMLEIDSKARTRKGEAFRRFYSEDQAFCRRAAAAGVEVFVYLGPGSPCTHWGTHGYKGAIEAFGLERQT